MSSRSSVDRTLGGNGFDSCRDIFRKRFFLCPTLVTCWSIHLSHFITGLKIHHLYSLIKGSTSFTKAFLASLGMLALWIWC